MKKIALLIVLCVTIKAFAQLPERTIAQPVKESYCQYDTLSNYPKQWAEYVGQDIIFLPVDTTYHGLWKEYNCFYCDSLLKTHYISKDTPNEYIDNKRFHVLNCKFISPYKTNYKPGLIFQLLSVSMIRYIGIFLALLTTKTLRTTIITLLRMKEKKNGCPC